MRELADMRLQQSVCATHRLMPWRALRYSRHIEAGDRVTNRSRTFPPPDLPACPTHLLPRRCDRWSSADAGSFLLYRRGWVSAFQSPRISSSYPLKSAGNAQTALHSPIEPRFRLRAGYLEFAIIVAIIIC